MIKKSRFIISVFMSIAILFIMGIIGTIDNTEAAETGREGYTEIDWEPTPNAYWYSNNKIGLDAELSTPENNSSATNHKYFIGSKLFTKDDLPIGSIIEIDEGYQYRPDGYLSINPPQPAPTRPGNVTKKEVVVDENWWGDFEHRGFNIAVAGGKTDITDNWQDVASHFRIFVPSDGENGNSDDPIKVLGIGNSFTEDGLSHLNSMAKADGVDIEVSILYIGGSELSLHWENANQNKAAYTLIEYKDGEETRTKGVTIDSVVENDDWDYVTLHQLSGFSGIASTYNPYLENIEKYVKDRAPEVETLIQQTWAYENGSSKPGFRRFEGDSDVMFHQVSEAYKLAAKKLGDVRVIPAGLAMKNAQLREPFDVSEGGVSLYRDGYHINKAHGRYLTAAVWYESLTDNDISENTFKPEGSISDEELATLQQEANRAVEEYTSEPANLDLKEDLNGLLYYEGQDYYDSPPNNEDEPVAELMPGERFDIQVDDLEGFQNGKYEVGALAAGEGSKYKIELNGNSIGEINRTANRFTLSDVDMTFINDTVFSLEKGDIISIIAPENGEKGWIDAVVLRNILFDEEDVDAQTIKELVTELSEAKEIKGDQTIRVLKMHLDAVVHFENQGASHKVIKHMEGFKHLLQKNHESLTKEAMNILNYYVDDMVEEQEQTEQAS